MAEPFLGQISIMSFAFPPKGWAFCNGQLLPINQNQALFALLGTMYGGDGRTNFALPDLRGRMPVHRGSGAGTNTVQGEQGGEEAHSLVVAEMPQHQHALHSSSDLANANAPGLALPAARPRGGITMYAAAGSTDVAMSGGSLGTAGGNQPHTNLQPFMTLSYVIALQGIFPSRS